MIVPTSPTEQLLFSTVRIESQRADASMSIGTGFFFRFSLPDNTYTTAIVTNKHVVDGGVVGRFFVHEANITGDRTLPSDNSYNCTIESFGQRWVSHPSPSVDLCALPFQWIQDAAALNGKPIYSIVLDPSLLRASEDLGNMSAVEDVLMIGYPNGLWDDTNNLPLVRRGITATHPSIDFKGQSVGVVDLACFPGSSGSPILIVNESMYAGRLGDVTIGQRVVLLGVLFGGPQITAEGQLVIKPIPTQAGGPLISRTDLMIHLGYYIKARELTVLGEELARTLGIHRNP